MEVNEPQDNSYKSLGQKIHDLKKEIELILIVNDYDEWPEIDEEIKDWLLEENNISKEHQSLILEKLQKIESIKKSISDKLSGGQKE